MKCVKEQYRINPCTQSESSIQRSRMCSLTVFILHLNRYFVSTATERLLAISITLKKIGSHFPLTPICSSFCDSESQFKNKAIKFRMRQSRTYQSGPLKEWESKGPEQKRMKFRGKKEERKCFGLGIQYLKEY